MTRKDSRFNRRRRASCALIEGIRQALSEQLIDPADDLRRYVRRVLAEHQIRQLASDEELIGTGGTIRNLAKMDRYGRTYPISRLHGYVLTRRRMRDVFERLASRSAARRRAIPGLNADRADSIVGGALGGLMYNTLFGSKGKTIDALEATPIGAKVRA